MMKPSRGGRADRSHTHPWYIKREQLQEYVKTTDPPIISAGVGVVPGLVGSASAVVQVMLKVPMKDTGYQAVPVLTGTASLLATLSITSWSVVSVGQVNVTVQNTGLLTLSGASVLVVALQP